MDEGQSDNFPPGLDAANNNQEADQSEADKDLSAIMDNDQVEDPSRTNPTN